MVIILIGIYIPMFFNITLTPYIIPNANITLFKVLPSLFFIISPN